MFNQHRQSVLMLLVVAMPTMIVGCVETRVVNDGWKQLRALSDNQNRDPDRRDREDSMFARYARWAILLDTFDGPGHEQHARQLLEQLAAQHHMPDLWIRSEMTWSQLYRGRYRRADQDQATRDLRQTHLISFAGDRRFRAAAIVPVGAGPMRLDDPLDLYQFAGDDLMTLQIGYYDEQYGKDFREAAELAAKELREQGDQAFYYHGPNRSLLTVGLFGQEDLVQHTTPGQDGRIFVQTQYSQRVVELQKKYPHNLGNGLTLLQKQGGRDIGAQPSSLVRVPD
ncbi:MAG: hypothetical protein QF735_06315 [Phycisphaeraceae bacterium]|nr:hypothetical protein [Phycisphaeraceae bacterium]